MGDNILSLPTALVQREAARALVTAVVQNQKFPLSRDVVKIFVEEAAAASPKEARRLAGFFLVLAAATAEYANARAFTLMLLRAARSHLAAGR